MQGLGLQVVKAPQAAQMRYDFKQKVITFTIAIANDLDLFGDAVNILFGSIAFDAPMATCENAFN